MDYALPSWATDRIPCAICNRLIPANHLPNAPIHGGGICEDCCIAEREADADEDDEWSRAHRLDIRVVIGRLAGYSGYVRVPESHPYFGAHYREVAPHVAVHGCLTYAGETDQPGTWWFGFDTGHSSLGDFEEPKSEQYVREQAEQLAEQLARIAADTESIRDQEEAR